MTHPLPPPSPPSLPPPLTATAPTADALAQVGVHVKLEWVRACVTHLQRATPEFATLSVNAQVGECYLQFLEADMDGAGAGCLPPGGLDGRAP